MSDHPALRAAKRAVSACGDPTLRVQETADRRKMPPVPSNVQVLPVRRTLIHVSHAVRFAAGGLWPTFNPSVTVHGSELVAVVRMHEPNSTTTLRRSVNIIGHLDTRTGVLHDAVPVVYRPDPTRPLYFEDVRLISIGDRLYGCASACDRVGPPQFAVLDFDSRGGIEAAHIQPSPGVQKNWMPATLAGRMGLVYSTEPVVLVSYDEQAHTCVPAAVDLPPIVADTARGGSQLVRLPDGGWLAVVHNVFGRPPYTHESLVYLHRFARFSPDLSRVFFGPYWHIGERPGIEYVAGLARYDDQWVLSYGARDREAWVATLLPDAERLIP